MNLSHICTPVSLQPCFLLNLDGWTLVEVFTNGYPSPFAAVFLRSYLNRYAADVLILSVLVCEISETVRGATVVE